MKHDHDADKKFEASRRLTEEWPGLLDTMREEIRQIVKEEIDARALSDTKRLREALDELLHEPSAKKRRRSGSGSKGSLLSWIQNNVAIVIGVLTTVLAGAAIVYFFIIAPPRTQPRQPDLVADARPAPEDTPSQPTGLPKSFNDVVDRYDDAIANRDRILASLVQNVGSQTKSAALTEVANRWLQKVGLSDEETNLLHVGLLQVVLIKKAGDRLTVDGVMGARVPCKGATCSAVLRTWPIDPALQIPLKRNGETDPETMRQVEKYIIQEYAERNNP